MKTENLDIRNCDCMDLMREYEDNHFDLAVVDPPYGIGMSGGNVGYKGGNELKRKEWDNAIPPLAYFQELERVAKNRIIWGGNYFPFVWPCRGYVVWDKGAGFRNRTYAESEPAWTSFDRNAKTFSYDPLAGGDYKGKIHPTQKPVKLYDWILRNYAEKGMKILDTHLGSGSSAIACHYAECHLTACELDKDYYEQACKRIERETRQMTLFT